MYSFEDKSNRINKLDLADIHSFTMNSKPNNHRINIIFMLTRNIIKTGSYTTYNKHVKTNLKELNSIDHLLDQNEIKLKINNKKATKQSSYVWILRKYAAWCLAGLADRVCNS